MRLLLTPSCSKTKSQTRCSIKRDAGLTRANTTGIKYCCIFFARGCCPYGWECEYQHTLPDPNTAMPDSSKDCFARDKFSDYRDDMGGVGSFNRQNRTLYVGRIKETGNGQETEEVVNRHFKEFGVIERSTSLPKMHNVQPLTPITRSVRILQYRSVAFVTYVHEVHAQFAKEAMACQSLDNDEILNVRWATEDPNPVQKVAEKRRLEDMGQEAIRARMDPRIVDAMRSVRALEDGDVLDEEGNTIEFEEEGEGNDGEPGAKRRRVDVEESASPEPQPQPAAMGLLSADTLEGLKYFAEIRKRNGVAPVVQKSAPPLKSATLALADYGSDSDDD